MALKDCKFYVNINGKQVEMDFDGFRAHLMQEGVMATLAPDLTKRRGKSAGFTLTARAEAAPARAEAPKARAEAPALSEMGLTAENLRKLMPKLGKSRAEAIVALMKAMGIPFERIKLARGDRTQLPKDASPLGSIEFLDDLNTLISVFEKANFSTVLHEGMHFYRRHMLNVENGFTAKQIKEFEDWAGAKNGVWSVAAEEKAARGFEKYLRDGKAPTAKLATLFKKVAAWMRQVYETLAGSAIDIDIPPNIREVFDRIFTLEAERQGKTSQEAQRDMGTRSLQQADFTPAPDVREAAKRWAGVKEITPAVSSRLVEFYTEYSQITDRIKEALRSKPISDIAGVLPNTEMFANVEQGLPEASRPNFKEWIGGLIVDLISDGVPSFAIKGVAQSFGVSEADIKRLMDLTGLVFPKALDVVPDSDLMDFGFEDVFIAPSPEVENKAGASLKELSDKGTFKTGKPVLVEVYHGTGAEGIKGNQFSPAFAGTASNAESAETGYFFSGTSVTAGRYASKTADKAKWAAPPKVLKFFVKMRNPLVVDQEADALKGGLSVDAIDSAKAAGYDGVIITNTFDGGPLDSIFVVLRGNEDQIKSADPTTYDDAGKPIAMEQRFQEGNRDIRYQKEGEAAPEGETATDAYARQQREARQAAAVDIMRNIGRVNKAPGVVLQARPAESPTPSPVIAKEIERNRRALIAVMERLTNVRRDIQKSGRSWAEATEMELRQAEWLMNRAEQLAKINPVSPEMDDEFAKVLRLEKTDSDVSRQLEKAAQKAFGISNFVEGGTHKHEVRPKTTREPSNKTPVSASDKQLILETIFDESQSGLIADHRQAIVKLVVELRREKLVMASTWREDVKDYLEGNRGQFSETKKRRFEQLVQDAARIVHGRPLVEATAVFKTGEPVLVSVYRGGELEGGEFREEFLGAYTEAPSAKLGYFFAGRWETSKNYSNNIQRYFIAMYNPLVYDFKGIRRRVTRLSKVIRDAYANGHDGVIAVNIYDPEPIDNVFIIPPGGEHRIKAYGTSYESKKKAILLSERFNPTTKNVLYQEEGAFPLPEGETTAAAFRRKQAEERQKRLEAAMNKLREGAGKATEQAKTEAPKAAPKAEPKETASKTPPKPARPKAPKQSASSQRRRGFGDKTVDEIFERLIERAEEGTLKSVPMSATEALESRIMNGLRKVIMAAYVENTLDPSVADEALKAAKGVLDAQASGEQGRIDDAVKAFRNVVSKASKPKTRKSDSASSQRRRGFGDKTVDEIFERLIKRAEEGTLKSVPMSATEALESRIMNGLRKVIMAAYVENTLDPSVADEALKAAKEVLDAQASGEQGRMDDAVKAFRNVVSKASKPKTRKSDEERLKEKEARVGQPKKVKSDEELVEAEINRYMGLFAERKDKLDAEIEIDGQKVSRREYLLKAMEDLRQAVKAKDILGQAKARSVMRSLIILPPYPSRPLKFTEMINPAMWGKDAPRSPLSTLNIIGSYEAVAGELGKMVSEVFHLNATLLAQKYYSSTAESLIDLEKQLEPLLVKLDEQGYRGMRPTIEAHVERMRESYRGMGEINKENVRRALEDKQVGNLTASVMKAFVFNTSLRFNPKSVLMNILQPLFTLWPFLTTREFVAIAIDAWRPKTIARVRDIAIQASGGRYEALKPGKSSRFDPFSRASEAARIMGHLAGELIAERRNLVGPNRYRYITEWTAKVEFDNSARNVPPLFSGPLKSTAFQFKAYTVKNLERFYYDWTRGVEGASSGTAARRAKMITAQVVVGGVGSLLTVLPGLKSITGVLLLGYLAQGLSKMVGDDEWGNKLAEAIYYGAPAFVSLDLSSSVGFLDEPFGNTIAEQALNFLTGPAIYKSVAAAQEIAKYFDERKKPAPLGRESEKEERLERQGRKVFRAITPLARMGETAYDVVVKRKRPELYLDKEMPLTNTEVVLRLAGGSPLRQTRFFDEKEAYDWQKKLLNRPVDIPGVERLKGEPESTYQLRVQRRQEYQQRFLPQLQAAQGFQRLPKPEQDAVLDALQRNITEQASMKKPDLSKLTPGYLLRARFAGAPERREREKKRLYNEPEEVK